MTRLTDNQINGAINDLWGSHPHESPGVDTIEVVEAMVGELEKLQALVKRLAASDPEVYIENVVSGTVCAVCGVMYDDDADDDGDWHHEWHADDCPWTAARRYVDGGAA